VRNRFVKAYIKTTIPRMRITTGRSRFAKEQGREAVAPKMLSSVVDTQTVTRVVIVALPRNRVNVR